MQPKAPFYTNPETSEKDPNLDYEGGQSEDESHIKYEESSQFMKWNSDKVGIDLVRRGDHAGAIKYYMTLLSISDSNGSKGADRADNASLCDKIGAIYFLIGSFSQACVYFEKSLAINERACGTNYDPRVAVSLTSVAKALEKMNKHERALKMYRRAFDIRVKIYGKKHERTIDCQIDLAWTLRNLKKYGEAIECFSEVLRVQLKMLKVYHVDVVTSYTYLGKVHMEKGDYRRSLACCERALSISQSVSGNESPETASCYFHLGRVLHERGDYKRSIECYEKSLVIRESLHSHRKIAMTYFHIGMAFEKYGDANEALTCMLSAVKIEDDCPRTKEGVQNCSIIASICCNKIASISAYEKKDYDKTLYYLLKALDYFLAQKQSEADTRLRILYDAIKHYRKALTVRNRAQGYDQEGTCRCCHNIGMVLMRAGNYDMALFYVATVMEIRERSPEFELSNLVDSYKSMEAIYRFKGDIKKSKGYSIKAKKLLEQVTVVVGRKRRMSSPKSVVNADKMSHEIKNVKQDTEAEEVRWI